MNYIYTLLAIICAFIFASICFVVGSWIYFKMEDFFCYLSDKLSRR